MRIPFFNHKRPELYKGMFADFGYMPSGELATPRLRPRTLEQALAARERSRRIRANGGRRS